MAYAATIFLSSFLLFLVQPMIAKLILPWFGGSAAVWTTCMLFFQSALLAGYAYAHATNARLAPRAQAMLHTALLAVAVALLPIIPAAHWKPLGDEEPIVRILLVLGATLGLQYLLLASTSPLLQAWYARARPGENPYRLFAVSNLASLLALVGYPVAMEPYLGSRQQVLGWSALFAAFALLCAWIAWRSARAVPASGPAQEASAAPPRIVDYLLWLALSAAGSVLLLAVTNHVTQNVASIPQLWLAPLTLYLLTFILAFDGRIYRPRYFWPPVLAAIAAMAFFLYDTVYMFNLAVQLAGWLSCLFVACLFCHGELYRTRPAPHHLTAFYLTVSAGGALGGVLVAVVAPLAFNAFYELGIGVVAVALLAAVRFAPLHAAARFGSLAVLLVAAAAAVYDGLRFERYSVLTERSFYGVLRVKEFEVGTEGWTRRLLHGVIMHGEQFMSPGRRGIPTTYYQRSSGVGVAIAAKEARGPVRVGVIGLGAGTIAAYGRPGDVFRFYDINPQVVVIARSMFTFLSDSGARIEIALGDARLSLEREPPENFDVLAVDAFSSDAIPVHLITREALGVYLRHVKRDGIVAFHVSNRYLDLVPVVARLARVHGLHAVLVADRGKDDDEDDTTSDWVLVSRDAAALAAKQIVDGGARPPEQRPDWRTWTDDYSNLVQILK